MRRIPSALCAVGPGQVLIAVGPNTPVHLEEPQNGRAHVHAVVVHGVCRRIEVQIERVVVSTKYIQDGRDGRAERVDGKVVDRLRRLVHTDVHRVVVDHHAHLVTDRIERLSGRRQGAEGWGTDRGE